MISEESNQSGTNPDVELLIKETDLSQVPVVVYGKANSAVNFGEPRWIDKNDLKLARLVLFNKNSELLYGEGKAFDDIPFGVDIGTRNIIKGSNESLDKIDPMYKFLTGRDAEGDMYKQYLQGEGVQIRWGEADLCAFENLGDGKVGILYSFRPSNESSMQRGDWKLTVRITVSQENANKLLKDFEEHPKHPYELFQTLFPSAFTPSVTVDELRSAWESQGVNAISSSYTESYLAEQSEFKDIVTPGEKRNPNELYEQLKPYEDTMIQGALNATKLSRFAPQKQLVLVDTRGIDKLTFPTFRKDKSPLALATKIIPVT